MAAFALEDDEIHEVLAQERVARVSFHDGDSAYLVPLGYVWLQLALHGVMAPGLKARLAADNPRVAFQVDTSGVTGLFEWRSVTGKGIFEVVTSPEARRETMAAFEPVIAAAPDWWHAEQAPKISSGELQVWRITPIRMSGRRYGPPAQGLLVTPR